MALFHSFLWLSKISLYVCTTSALSICWWTFSLLPRLGCCKQCCSERSDASIFFNNLFIFIFGCIGSSLPRGLFSAESGGYSLVVPRELLIMVASLVSKHGLWVCGTQQLLLVGSTVVVHRLWCSVACGISLDQGLNLCLLHQQVDSHWATREAHMYFFKLWFSLDICPGVRLQDHIIALYFKESPYCSP